MTIRRVVGGLLRGAGRAYLRMIARAVPRPARARFVEEWLHELDRVAGEVERGGSAAGTLGHLHGAIADMRALRRVGERDARAGLRALALEVRGAAATLRATPRFSLTVLAVFALGIGPVGALAGFVDTVLLRPLPLERSERLMQVEFHQRDRETGSEFRSPRLSHALVEAWRERVEELSGVAAVYDASFENVFYLTEAAEPERVRGALVSAGFFELLGARPLLGRPFRATDDRTGLAKAIVIAERLWRRQLGADPDALGRELRVNGQAFRVVAVMAENFAYRSVAGGPLGALVEAWVPLQALDSLPGLPGREARMAVADSALLRLAEGADPSRVRARLEAVCEDIAPAPPHLESRVELVGLRSAMIREARTPLLQLLGGGLILLLLICVNVSGLQVARSVERGREFAIRAALGAGRGRLVRQVALEVILLAVVGFLLAIPVAATAAAGMVAIAPEGIPRTAEVALDARAMALVAALALPTGAAAALLPALQVLRRGHAAPSGSRSTGFGSARTGRLRGVLVAAQIALASVLLAGGGLLVRSASELAAVEHGLDVEGVLAVDIYRPYTAGPGTDSERAYFAEVLEQASTLPRVSVAALTSSAPFRPRDYYAPEWRRRIVSPDYFEATGMRLLRGRGLQETDGPDAPEVAVINETLARQRFGQADPIGRALGPPEDPGPTVVGVVEDVRHVSVDQEPLPAAYLPLAAYPDPRLTLLVRADADPAALVALLVERLRAIDPEQPLSHVTTLEASLRASDAVHRRRFHLRLVGLFGAAATLLALFGLYSVIRQWASARTREFAVRVALGARPARIVGSVLGQAGRLAGIGGLVGIAAALGVTRFLGSVLYGVEPSDPVTLAAVVAGLMLMAVVAAWLPARSALRQDPARALR